MGSLTAYGDAYSAGQGRAITIPASRGVLVNDRDPDGKTLIAILATNPVHGTLTFNPDGSFVYTNDGTGASSDGFSYQASNGTTRSNIAPVTITLGAPDTVTAAADGYSLPHAGTLSVAAPGVLGNDTDPNGFPLVALGAVQPVHGTLSLAASGAFSYTHDGSNTTADSFAYRATNGTLTSAVTIVSLNVASNVPPTVASQRYTITQNGTLSVPAPGVLAGATDPDSQTLTAAVQSPASHGSVALDPSGSFVYKPATGYAGADSFTYRASDGISTSVPGTAAIAVEAPTTPVAVDDRYVATASALTISAPGVFANDTLGGATLISFGANGNDQAGIGFPAVTSQNGLITLNADGSFTYTAPGPSFAGDDTFRYVVSNAAGSATATVTITVSRINPNCSAITIAPQTLPAAKVGSVYPAVSFTQTGGTAPVSWSNGTLPPGMQFSNSGTLSGTPTSRGSFNITITVTDAKGCTAIVTVVLSVDCPTIAIADVAFPPAVTGIAYASVTLSQTGGTAPVVWSLATGKLPAGMTLTEAGVIAGTPAAPGTSRFSVKATDANGCFNTRDYQIVVEPPCPAITLDIPTLADATVGSAYPNVAFRATGGTAPYTWDVVLGSLPPGMTFPAGGVLSGTPTQTGTFDFTVEATDANGCAQSKAVQIVVSATCSITISGKPPGAKIGQPYQTFAFTHNSTSLPVTWTYTALPAGMVLSEAGVLSGTPTVRGTFTLQLQVTDAKGCKGTAAIAFTIDCPAINVDVPTLTNATVGSAYPNVNFQATGGTAPYAWNVVLGSLPPGMKFPASGVLSGTPTQTGTFDFTVEATDANGCAQSKAVQLVVSATCSITISGKPPGAKIGQPYQTFAFTHNSTSLPVTWSYTALPAGMVLSEAGVLSGTPTVRGAFTLQLQVTDAKGCKGTAAIAFIIDCPAIAVDPPGLADATLGSAYPNVNFRAAGGTAPYTWDVVLGSLPPGMKFPASGVLSGTPTQTGTFDFTVEATDANGCAQSKAVQLVVSATCSITISGKPPGAKIGQPYQTFAFTHNSTSLPVTWTYTALPAGMVLSEAGVLSGTPTVRGSFTLQLQVTDAKGCRGTAAIAFTIDCPAIAVDPPGLADATLGSAYPNVNFRAAGGTAPYSWDVVLGSLPPGMKFPATGVLSGTPTQTGTFNFTVEATDANGCAKSQAMTLIVAATCSITISGTPPDATIGQPYQTFAFTHNSTSLPVTWTYTALPSGMVLSEAGILSGTPAVRATFTLQLQVTDAKGCKGTAAISFTIACPTIAIASSAAAASGTLPNASIGTAYGPVVFTQTGGAGDVVWSLSNTTPLPAGLSLSPTGRLTGTPAVAGSRDFTVVVTDANGCTSQKTYAITVCQTISVHNPPQTTAGTGTAFSATFTSGGGNGTVTYTTASPLPAGLSLSATAGDATTAVLSGTPAEKGTFPIVVTATDSKGCTGSGSTYSLVVSCGPIAVTNPAVTTGTVGTPLASNLSFTATSTIGAKTYTTISGAFPPGVTLNAATGTISGTPTTIGTYTPTVQVEDSLGCRASSPYTLTIGCLAVTMSPSTLTKNANETISEQLTATGGTAPRTWTRVSGGLPDGLSLSSAGLLSGKTHETGTFELVLRVTDASNCSADLTFTLTINGTTCTIGVDTTDILGTEPHEPIDATFTATGGSGTKTFSAITTLFGPHANPLDIAVDPSGHVYVADAGSNRVWKWRKDNRVESGSDGTLSAPGSVAVNGSYLYISDTNNNQIERHLLLTFSFFDNYVNNAGLNQPHQIALDANGNLYIADSGNNAIKKRIPSSTTLQTLVDGLNNPRGIAVTSTGGAIYFSEPALGTIKKYIPASNTTSLVISGLVNPHRLELDAAGNLYYVQGGKLQRLTPDGRVKTLVDGLSPTAVTLDGNGTVHFTDVSPAGGGAKILGPPPQMSFTQGGVLSGTPTVEDTFPMRVIATDASGCSGSADFTVAVVDCPSSSVSPSNSTQSVVTGTSISKTFTATNNTAARWELTGAPAGLTLVPTNDPDIVTLSGVTYEVNTFVITITAYNADNCPARATFTLTVTCGVVVSPSTTPPTGKVGQSYSATFTATGGQPATTTFMALTRLDVKTADNKALTAPQGLTADAAGNVWIADTGRNRIVRYAPSTDVTTVLDIPNLNAPGDVVLSRVAPDTTIFISDTGNSRILKVDPTVSEVAGPPEGLSEGLNHPQQIAVDQNDVLYIADTGSNSIKKIAGTTVTTIASGLSAPTGIAVTPNGNLLYFSEAASGTIKSCNPSSCTAPATILQTVANPRRLSLDSAGNLYFRDATTANLIRKRTPAGVVTTVVRNVDARAVAVNPAGVLYLTDFESLVDYVKVLAAPPSLSFSLQGTLSGTPTLDGRIFIRIYASDSANGCYDFENFQITINP